MDRSLCATTEFNFLQGTAIKASVCPKCRHGNIRAANFCGSCGNRLERFSVSAALGAALHSGVSGVCGVIRNLFSVDSLYRFVLLVAVVVVLSSGMVSYRLLNDTSVIKVSPLPFTDVAMDHPVYFMCDNLLKLKAVSYRSFLRLAPYDEISVSEWNYAVRKVADHLNNRRLLFLCLEGEEEVTDSKLKGRFEALGYYDLKTDSAITRMSAYASLDRLLSERSYR
jgi:hypothetical protein